MVRAYAVRIRGLGLLAVVAVLAAGAAGCTSDRPEPEPSPEPAPRYQPVPRDLCERLRVEEIAARFDLTIAPSYEPSTAYHEAPSWWSMGCRFDSLDGDERFAWVLGGLDPRGSVSVTVYREPERAAEQYRLNTRSFTRPRPQAAVADIEGWWDEGMSVAVVERVPQGSLEEDPHASRLQVNYFIHHQNLLLEAYLEGWSPTGETDEALDLLHDILDALVEETITHLTLTES